MAWLASLETPSTESYIRRGGRTAGQNGLLPGTNAIGLERSSRIEKFPLRDAL